MSHSTHSWQYKHLPYTISYKRVKHGYVRLHHDGTQLALTIPHHKRRDRLFLQQLLKAGLRLQQSYQQKTKIQTRGEDRILIRWERIATSQLPRPLWEHLQTVCYHQAKAWADLYSQQIGIQYQQLRIRPLRSKWWSCSPKQNISLSRHLVHLPKQYLHYVTVHEICHLLHKHHQPPFWQLVAELMPGYEKLKRELNQMRLV